jgi:hypothetical protein
MFLLKMQSRYTSSSDITRDTFVCGCFYLRRSKETWEQKHYVRLYINCPLVFNNFNTQCDVSTDCNKTVQYQISQ